MSEHEPEKMGYLVPSSDGILIATQDNETLPVPEQPLRQEIGHLSWRIVFLIGFVAVCIASTIAFIHYMDYKKGVEIAQAQKPSAAESLATAVKHLASMASLKKWLSR